LNIRCLIITYYVFFIKQLYICSKYKDHNETRDTKIRLLAREKPTRGKPNNPSLIESDQNERYPIPMPRPNCHQVTKSNPHPIHLQIQSQRWSNYSKSSQHIKIQSCNKGSKFGLQPLQNFRHFSQKSRPPHMQVAMVKDSVNKRNILIVFFITIIAIDNILSIYFS